MDNFEFQKLQAFLQACKTHSKAAIYPSLIPRNLRTLVAICCAPETLIRIKKEKYTFQEIECFASSSGTEKIRLYPDIELSPRYSGQEQSMVYRSHH